MKYLKDLKKGNKVTVILPDNKIIDCVIDHRSVVDEAIFIGIESTEVNGKVFKHTICLGNDEFKCVTMIGKSLVIGGFINADDKDMLQLFLSL